MLASRTGHKRLWGAKVFSRVSLAALFGYMLLGRPLAWIHIPGVPLFLGELVLALSIVIIARNATAPRPRLPALMRGALALFWWGMLRLAWDVWDYGILAARDAGIVLYIPIAYAAFLVFSGQADLADRLAKSPLLHRFVRIYLVWAIVALLVSRLGRSISPVIPDSEALLLGFKPGDLGTFLAIWIAYGILHTRGMGMDSKKLLVFMGVGFVGVVVIGTQNRGALVAAAVTISLALWISQPGPTRRRVLWSLLAGFGLVVLLLGVTDIEIETGGRSISIDQFTAGIESIVGESDVSNLEGTISWRLEYWSALLEDLAAGSHWLVGVGYGEPLPNDFGFQVASADSAQPLRNAHNSHVTLVTRLGSLGGTMWVGLWLVMFGVLLEVRSSGVAPSVGWLAIALLGIGVNAIFDPVLEGPQVAVPFWIGFGILCALRTSRRTRPEQIRR